MYLFKHFRSVQIIHKWLYFEAGIVSTLFSCWLYVSPNTSLLCELCELCVPPTAVCNSCFPFNLCYAVCFPLSHPLTQTEMCGSLGIE